MKNLMFSLDPENTRLKRYTEIVEELEMIDMSRAQGRFARLWKGYRAAKYILMLERFDLVAAQEIEHSFLAWLLSSKFNIPWQMQIHTDIFSPYYFRESLFNKLRVF